MFIAGFAVASDKYSCGGGAAIAASDTRKFVIYVYEDKFYPKDIHYSETFYPDKRLIKQQEFDTKKDFYNYINNQTENQNNVHESVSLSNNSPVQRNNLQGSYNLRIDANIAAAFKHSYHAQHHNFSTQSNNSQGHYVRYNHFVPMYHHTTFTSTRENVAEDSYNTIQDDHTIAQTTLVRQQEDVDPFYLQYLEAKQKYADARAWRQDIIGITEEDIAKKNVLKDLYHCLESKNDVVNKNFLKDLYNYFQSKQDSLKNRIQELSGEDVLLESLLGILRK